MHRGFIKLASLLGALSVGLGALSTHTLKARITVGGTAIFETALRYQFYHVFALLAAGILFAYGVKKIIRTSGILFICGMVLFCGPIYFITLAPDEVARQFNKIVYLAPVGGSCFIAGWLMLFAGVWRADSGN